MIIKRGDVVVTRVPHASGGRGKKRPAVVVQADVYNATLRHAVVAEVTTNPRWMADPACLPTDVTTPEGKATGLDRDGAASCLHLVMMSEERLGDVIGSLSPALLSRLDACLKAALGLP